jgi:hypothetical protein
VAITAFNSFSGYLVSGDSFFAISLSTGVAGQVSTVKINGFPMKVLWGRIRARLSLGI